MSSLPGASAAGSIAAVLELLSALDDVLGLPVKDDARLTALAELVVPAWADGCAISLLQDDSLQACCSVGEIPLGAATRLPSRRSWVRCEDGTWILDLVLAAGERKFGVLRLSLRAESASILPQLANEIARRVALALDTERTLEEEREIARAFQRSLIPERLPSVDGVRIDAAYRPAVDELLVGGDWYDAFELSDGRIALSIGDVAGHGLNAALLMNEARQAVHSAALTEQAPSKVLAAANALLGMRKIETMITAIFGVYDPQNSSFSYACAGHHAPILAMSDGSVQELPHGGLPLGLLGELEAQDWTITLFPGSLIVLYTDGLVEVQHDFLAGLELLKRAISQEVKEDSGACADALQQFMFSEKSNIDDTATLTLRAVNKVTRRFEATFTAVPLAVPIIRCAVEAYTAEHGLGEDATFDAATSIGEALANSIEHAYRDAPGNVHVVGEVKRRAIEWKIEDFGTWRRPTKSGNRGYGIPLMRTLAEKVELHVARSGTTVTFRSRLP